MLGDALKNLLPSSEPDSQSVVILAPEVEKETLRSFLERVYCSSEDEDATGKKRPEAFIIGAYLNL